MRKSAMFPKIVVLIALMFSIPPSSSQFGPVFVPIDFHASERNVALGIAPPAFEKITIPEMFFRLTPVLPTASTTTTPPTTTTKKRVITTTSTTTVKITSRTTTLKPLVLSIGENPSDRIEMQPPKFPMIVAPPVHSTILVPAPSPIPFNGNVNSTVRRPQPVPGLPTDAPIAINPENELIPETGIAPPVFKNETIIEASNGTSNGQINGTISVTAFCGYPPYNDRLACVTQNYYQDNLSQCEVEGGVIVFCFFSVLLGILIIFANIFLPLVVWRNPDMRTQYGYIKVSLAISDMLMGILLLTSVLPNVFRIRNLPLGQAVLYMIEDTNSPSAVITGSLLTVSMQASVLHLMFLSIERFTAINWPLWHIRRKTSTIAAILVGLWAVSLLSSFIPAAFPKYFEYKLQPALLVRMMTLKELADDETGEKYLGYQGPLYAFFSLILPYSIMVVFCILTGIVVYNKLTSGVRKFNQDHGDGARKSATTNTSSGNKSSGTVKKKQSTKTKLKPEISVFITIIIMIFAFTITLLPFATIMTLFVVGQLNCSNYTIPFVIAFYIGLLNSLANPFIYTLRDRKFRSALRSIFCPKKITIRSLTKSTSNGGSNHSTQL